MTLVIGDEGSTSKLDNVMIGRWDRAFEETLRLLVEKYLGLYLYTNATFLGERLYALKSSQENLYLLATCYLRSNQPNRAYSILQKNMEIVEYDTQQHLESSLHVQLRYLFALCCFTLNYLREAESALLQNTPVALQGPQKCVDYILNENKIPNGAAGLYLLGQICAKDNRVDHAMTYFGLALKMDPYLWDAYEKICTLGMEVSPDIFFGLPLSDGLFDLKQNGTIHVKHQTNHMDVKENCEIIQAPIPIAMPMIQSQRFIHSFPKFHYVSGFQMKLDCDKNGGSKMHDEVITSGYSILQDHNLAWPTPILTAIENSILVNLEPSDSNIIYLDEDNHQSTKHFEHHHYHQDEKTVDMNYDFRPTTARRSTRKSSKDETNNHTHTNTMPTRRSTRQSRKQNDDLSTGAYANSNNSMVDEMVNIDSENQYSAQANTILSNSPKVSKVENYQPPHINQQQPLRTLNAANVYEHDSEYHFKQHDDRVTLDMVIGSLLVLDLLQSLGKGTYFLHQYRCMEALDEFNSLPILQQQTGWVAHMKGKANFEIGKYREAKEEFERMREYAPDRTAGLEIYSTNLWHLKEEVELCYLAQHALELDKKSPESWCAIGNCFSLQKEHDIAIKYFQRALQIDPSFTYAYTLSGHEYVSNEDFEKAVACYRHAIRTDARHYNAWYGLGTIYYRQEKYDLAEYHFRRAISINPRSSVLHCYLGMVLHASEKCDEALEVLQRASDLEPSNPQSKFQRALVLRTMECFDAALEELQSVRDYAPRESSVYFLMGKIYKQLGRKEEALLAFTTALDLDPKDSNLIKAAIDKLDSPDIDETDDL